MNEKTLAVIKSDYYSVLADFGITHQEAYAQSINENDLIFDEIDSVEIKDSEIHGKGIFSKENFKQGDKICIGRIGNKRTIAGRYTNHAPNKNAFFMFEGNNISLFAFSDIAIGDEITIDYRDALALQISKEKQQFDLIVQSKEIGAHNTTRLMMTGLNAVAYDLFFSEDHIACLSTRERVLAFEAILELLPQDEIEPTHEFIDGLYRREITFKKGTFATGKIHRDDHMDVVLSGEMIVVTDNGFEHIKGPCCRTSIAGRKKAGYALTDVVWVTYHPTKTTTIEDVEKELFIDDFDEIVIKPEEVL